MNTMVISLHVRHPNRHNLTGLESPVSFLNITHVVKKVIAYHVTTTLHAPIGYSPVLCRQSILQLQAHSLYICGSTTYL